MLINLAFGRLRQKAHHEFKVSLGDIIIPCLKQATNKQPIDTFQTVMQQITHTPAFCHLKDHLDERLAHLLLGICTQMYTNDKEKYAPHTWN